jgi:hypothetical protein
VGVGVGVGEGVGVGVGVGLGSVQPTSITDISMKIATPINSFNFFTTISP